MSSFHDEYPYIGPVWYRSALSPDEVFCVGIAECKQVNDVTELMLLDGRYAGEKITADFIYVPKKKNDDSLRKTSDAIKLLGEDYKTSLIGISLFEKKYLQEGNGLKQNQTINYLKEKYYKKSFDILTSEENRKFSEFDFDNVLHSFIDRKSIDIMDTIEIDASLLKQKKLFDNNLMEKSTSSDEYELFDGPVGDNYVNAIIVEDTIKNISECTTPNDLKKVTVDLIDHLNRKFIGQSHAAELIAQNILVNQYYINKEVSASELKVLKSVLLVDGSTGTGKTAIIKEIVEKLNIPTVVTTSTAYSAVGYKGADLTDILEELLKQAHGNIKLAERGLVCVDEIDKLAQTREDTLVNKAAIQQELLTFIGGNKYTIDNNINDSEVTFDTSKLTFVGVGAFTKLRDASKKNTAPIGFERENDSKKDLNSEPQNRDYVEYGMMKEFMGRITSIITTKDYSVEDYKNILLESEISPLKGFIKSCSLLGVEKIDYTPEFIEELAKEAYEMENGARSLQRLINEVKEKYTLPILKGNVEKITLTPKELKRYYSKNKKSIVY